MTEQKLPSFFLRQLDKPRFTKSSSLKVLLKTAEGRRGKEETIRVGGAVEGDNDIKGQEGELGTETDRCKGKQVLERKRNLQINQLQDKAV